MNALIVYFVTFVVGLALMSMALAAKDYLRRWRSYREKLRERTVCVCLDSPVPYSWYRDCPVVETPEEKIERLHHAARFWRRQALLGMTVVAVYLTAGIVRYFVR